MQLSIELAALCS